MDKYKELEDDILNRKADCEKNIKSLQEAITNATDEAYENAKTYYVAPLNQKDKKLYKHPTIKPLELLEKFIKNSSHAGDIILDPFMGSGTTGVACKKLNRDFIGIEIDKDYFEIAKNRIETT